MRVDFYHHFPSDPANDAKLTEVLALLRGIKHQGETNVATQTEILAKLAEANASLDGIQADITALKALIDAGANLTEISDAVNALAAKASGIDAETP